VSPLPPFHNRTMTLNHTSTPELAGKTAIISGAASGIGRGIALHFAQNGANVALLDINATEGKSVEKKIRAFGGKAIFHTGDVTSDSDCEKIVQAALGLGQSLDILINNAGIIRRETILETSEDDWDRGMAVNVKSVYLLSRRTIPAMVEQGGGAIVNISSGWGLVGGRKAALYCTSKGAVIQLTRAMALDHGPQGIRVNCICPGDTQTGMLENEAQQLGENLQSFLRDAADRPVGRIGNPTDIAEAAQFLVSERSSFVTGTTLVVDGGGLAG